MANINLDTSVTLIKPKETVFSDLIGVGTPATTQTRKFFATQSSFTPSNNVCRIYLNSPGFLNLQDGVLSFTIKNNTAVNSYIDGSAHSFIDRLTVYGPDNTVLEQIENYNVLSSLVSDIQLNQNWRSTIGNALCGYSKDPNFMAKPLVITVTATNVFNVNGISVDITAAGPAVNAGDGFIFTPTAAGSFSMNPSDGSTAVTIVCGGAPSSRTVIVNGVTFESRSTVANTLFINGLAISLGAPAAPGARFNGEYIIGLPIQFTKNYTPYHQSEFLAATSGTRTFHIPLVSGVLQSNKYWPSQFTSGQGAFIEILWAPASSCLYVPGSTTSPDYIINDVYYQCPVIDFKGDFYMDIKNNVIDLNGMKWHVTNYQNNKRDYTSGSGQKTLTIGSKHRSLKSVVVALVPGSRSIQLPKSSFRNLPSSGAFQFRIGTVLYPPQPVKFDVNNVSELYAELLKAFSALGNIKADSCIDRYNLFWGCGAIGFDFENFAQTSSGKLAESGLNTIANNQQFDLLLTVDSGATGLSDGLAHMFCLHDVILMLTPDGRIIKSN